MAEHDPAENSGAVNRPSRVLGGPVRLRGRPQSLSGVVELAREAVPRDSFEVATCDNERTEHGYLTRLHFAPLLATSIPVSVAPHHVLAFGALPAPGTSAKVAVNFAVDPTTPPGRYQATFEVGGEATEAEIEVLANPALSVEPKRIKVSGPPGGVAREAVVMRNRGNVPFDLNVLGVLVFEEEQQVCLSLQEALGAVKSRPGEAGAHERFLDKLVESLAARATDFGKVRVAGGPVTIPPGGSEAIEIEVHLPRDMIAGRRYRALLKTEMLQLFIATTATSDQPTARGRRTARAS
jgi:hypothetical protein